MEENTRLSLLGIIIFFTTCFECNTYATTVYKFNTIRSKSDIPNYVNICSVSVHLENNHLGLAIFNTKDGSLPYATTIPVLYNASRKSEWKLERNGSLFPLSTSFDRMWQHKEILGEWYIGNEKSLFSENNGHKNLRDRDNLVLRVRFDTRKLQNEVKISFQFQNYYFIRFTFRNNKELSVLRKQIGYSDSDGIYTSEYSVFDYEVNCDISISKGNITVTDVNNYRVHNTGLYVPPQFGQLTNLVHWYDDSSTSGVPVNYTLIHFNYPNVIDSLVSPWCEIKKDTSFVILWYDTNETHPNEFNDTNISIYLDEEFTQNSIQLELFKLDQSNLNIKSLEQKFKLSNYSKGLLEEVMVRNPQNWSGRTRIRITRNRPSILIGNIWEGRNESHVKISNKQNCVKSELKDIYSVPVEFNHLNVGTPLFCYNGGQFYTPRCICPPGFIGFQCETPCNRNRFGYNCSLPCSKSSSECKGLVLCTEHYGCSCAPGYHGEKCLEQCEQGFYGADCKQTCGIGCDSGCDIYTGNCPDKICTMAHLFGPKCDQFYSHLREPPTFLDSNFTSVNLKINLTEDNIRRTHFFERSTPTFYIIQYREERNTAWKNDTHGERMYSPDIHIVTVDRLKPGRHYFFKVLVLETLLNTNDIKQIDEVSQGYTRCDNADIVSNLQSIEIRNTSITVSWDEKENDCPFLSYALQVEEIDGFDTTQINDIKETTYKIENLIPAQSYNIVLKKATINGHSDPLASTVITTSD